MIAIPASLRSDFIHIAGTGIHIALEPTIHITGIGTGWQRGRLDCVLGPKAAISSTFSLSSRSNNKEAAMSVTTVIRRSLFDLAEKTGLRLYLFFEIVPHLFRR
jgi:hypothetical protein